MLKSLLKRKNKMSLPKFRSTTVIAVKKDGKVAMAGDGQVTMGNTVMKGNARKVRRIYDGKVLTGFAGATADAFNLFDKFGTDTLNGICPCFIHRLLSFYVIQYFLFLHTIHSHISFFSKHLNHRFCGLRIFQISFLGI